MKKEEILEMSKEENQKKDPYVLEMQSKSGNVACIGMLVLAFFYLMYELNTKNSWNSAIYSIITIYESISYGYRGLKIEKNRKANIASSILWGIFTILLILDYFDIIFKGF